MSGRVMERKTVHLKLPHEHKPMSTASASTPRPVSTRTEGGPLDVATDQLDALIERRAKSTPDPDELEPSYAESVRRCREKERREHLWQCLRFHERQLQNHTRTFQEILDRHRAGVERCEEMLGIGGGHG